MKKITKSEKVIRWASQKRTRSFGKAIKELHQNGASALKAVLIRMKKKGFINYTINHGARGNSVTLGLTQAAYYYRSAFVK